MIEDQEPKPISDIKWMNHTANFGDIGIFSLIMLYLRYEPKGFFREGEKSEK